MGIWAAIKYALNSTLGTTSFSPIDEIIKDGNTALANRVSTLQSLLSQKSTAILGGAQRFTANGTFTVPANVTKIWITACAGGGAGEYSRSSGAYCSGGDGGDWILREPYVVTPGQKLAITIGKGGNSSGAVGGSTIISPLITLACPGQRGGKAGLATSANEKAGDGKDGFSSGGRSGYAMGAGGGSLGRGGSVNGLLGENGLLGGGGAGQIYSGSASFHKGGDGIVIIEW